MIKNINKHNWKLLSVSIINNCYEFRLIGYSDSSSQTGYLKINNHEIKCILTEVSDQVVSFAPKLPGIFLWETTAIVPKELINKNENLLIFTINDNIYPIEAWFEATPESLIVPDVENIKRVSGAIANKVSYRNGGRTEYLRYKELFNKYMKNKTNKYLLDWGVGCARVSQHFIQENKYKITGLDIDSINIEWCLNNIKNITPILVELTPPTPISSDKFDTVISSSVLSHLVPEHWTIWLAEIHRIMRSDGVAFISFHGDNSCNVFFGNNEQTTKTLSSNGFIDLNASPDLGVDLEKYYRNTFYTDDYAKELFSKYFSVVAIVPGLLSGSQSVAILEPKDC